MQIRYQLLSVAVTFAVAGNKIVLNNSRDSVKTKVTTHYVLTLIGQIYETLITHND